MHGRAAQSTLSAAAAVDEREEEAAWGQIQPFNIIFRKHPAKDYYVFGHFSCQLIPSIFATR